MMTTIILVIAGLALVVFGADWLVDGSSAIARRLGVSEFIIGLTIVGFGTSCPELVVSLTGALEGNSDISVGNVIGSNIFNTLFILGITAILVPVGITRNNRRFDIPLATAATLLLVFTGLDFTLFGIGGTDKISRLDGIVYLVLFAAYLTASFIAGKKSTADKTDGNAIRQLNILKAAALAVAGLCALVVGGRIFVDNSVVLAKAVGLSDKVIAITLLAGGTSLPELVTSVVATIKGKSQLALGNILGSNVFNILLILGMSAVVNPISLSSIKIADVAVMVAGMLVLMAGSFTFRRDRLDRAEGALLLVIFSAYYIWLFKNI